MEHLSAQISYYKKFSNEHKTKFYEGLNLDGTFLETVHPGELFIHAWL